MDQIRQIRDAAKQLLDGAITEHEFRNFLVARLCEIEFTIEFEQAIGEKMSEELTVMVQALARMEI